MGQIMHALRDSSNLVLAIEGMGGVGKTALALEVAEQCLIGHTFDAVIWHSAPRFDPSSSGTIESPRAFAFDDLLTTIAMQMDTHESQMLTPVQRERLIGRLMRQWKVLLVLDGIDLAPQFHGEILNRLISLLCPSKALLTSRHHFEGDIYRVQLSCFTSEEAVAFIRQEARERGLNYVLGARTSELEDIAHAAAFVPLALKFAVSMLAYRPLYMVAREFSMGKSAEIGHLYDFLFSYAWQMISADARQVLLGLSTFLPGISAPLEAIVAVSGLDRATVLRALDELYRISLIEKDESTSKEYLRYYLLPFTNRFISSVVERAAVARGNASLTILS